MSVQLPAKYDAARRALAAAVAVDEVKDILNKSIAMEVYAYQAKDAELSAWSAELHERAERKLGEVMDEERAAGRLAKGGQPYRSTGSTADPVVPTLAEQGIDKHLADRARKAAAMPADKFEARVAKTVAIAVAAVRGSKEVIVAARADSHKEKKEKREVKERQLAGKIAALPEARFGVILADPEWKFEFWSEKGQTNSSAENHYPTSALDVIKAREVPSICAEDCVLWLWATVPMLPQALEVMGAWGFGYVSHFVWVKDRVGTGYWNRNKHELLLIGTRGKVPAPAPGTQWPSAIEAPVGKHSEKPAVFYELIEAYFPNLPKIELNARGPARPGWDTWGMEAEAAE